jgi:predicted metal-dependent hydrolase
MVRIDGLEVHRKPTLSEQVAAICRRVCRELAPRMPIGEVQVRFCRFASDRSVIEARPEGLRLRISDLLEGAPLPVLEALTYILVGRLFRRPVPAKYQHRYRRFLGRHDFRRNLHLVRQLRGRKLLRPPQGRHYNLVEIFEELNHRFFNGLMARPELGWSRTASRRTLGHYDPSHNAIVISSYLDRPEVPRLALDYVLYHEMLHLRYPVEHRGMRRRIHTAEFREAEKRFPALAEAKELLRRL